MEQKRFMTGLYLTPTWDSDRRDRPKDKTRKMASRCSGQFLQKEGPSNTDLPIGMPNRPTRQGAHKNRNCFGMRKIRGLGHRRNGPPYNRIMGGGVKWGTTKQAFAKSESNKSGAFRSENKHG